MREITHTMFADNELEWSDLMTVWASVLFPIDFMALQLDLCTDTLQFVL